MSYRRLTHKLNKLRASGLWKPICSDLVVYSEQTPWTKRNEDVTCPRCRKLLGFESNPPTLSPAQPLTGGEVGGRVDGHSEPPAVCATEGSCHAATKEPT